MVSHGTRVQVDTFFVHTCAHAHRPQTHVHAYADPRKAALDGILRELAFARVRVCRGAGARVHRRV